MTIYIPVVGQPSPEQRSLFAHAKRSLQISDPMQFRPAVPGDDRVLSFTERPDFICNYGLVKSEISANIRDALAWVIGLEDNPRVATWSSWLAATMNGPVREVEDVPYSNPEPE